MLGGKMIDNRTAWANSARRLQRPDPCPGRPQSPARCRAGPGSWPGPNSQATCWEAASGQEGLGSRDSAAAPPAPASLEERGDSKPRASAAHPPWSQGTAAGLTRAARLFIRLGITDVRNKLLQLLQKRQTTGSDHTGTDLPLLKYFWFKTNFLTSVFFTDILTIVINIDSYFYRFACFLGLFSYWILCELEFM